MNNVTLLCPVNFFTQCFSHCPIRKMFTRCFLSTTVPNIWLNKISSFDVHRTLYFATMKFAVSFITGAVALRVADVHPTVNLVVTNDGAMDANAFSLAQASKSKTLRAELKDLVKSETHASLMEKDSFNQPNVLRINFESPHAALMESIIRESVADGAAYEEGEIGLNLIPAGSAASLKQLMTKTDADFETEFRSGLHASLMEAIRIRLPKGGLKEGDSLVSDDGVLHFLNLIQCFILRSIEMCLRTNIF